MAATPRGDVRPGCEAAGPRGIYNNNNCLEVSTAGQPGLHVRMCVRAACACTDALSHDTAHAHDKHHDVWTRACKLWSASLTRTETPLTCGYGTDGYNWMGAPRKGGGRAITLCHTEESSWHTAPPWKLGPEGAAGDD